ncbi:MAG: DUF1016 N-terminal domain-containing protein [Blastocatellia bacterium]|nr:DUF1016 N-terminal domain-containing protein [Blastocatellia bacterium]
MTKKSSPVKRDAGIAGYDDILVGVVDLLESARRLAARAVNSIMTATYWEIGRRIVEFEQGGKERADYGGRLLERLSQDLSSRFGRGFSIRNLRSFRAFYLGWTIRQTPSAESEQLPDTTEKLQTLSAILSNQKIQTASGQSQDQIRQMVSAEIDFGSVARLFQLSWSHYVKLMSVKNPKAREFYEAEALRGGWSVRQLARQINSMFYERTALSRNKAAMLRKGRKPLPEDAIMPEEEHGQLGASARLIHDSRASGVSAR